MFECLIPYREEHNKAFLFLSTKSMDPKYCWFITALLLFVSCQKAAAIREQKKGRACLDLQQKRHHSMLSSSPLWKTKPLPPHHKAVMPSLQPYKKNGPYPHLRFDQCPLAATKLIISHCQRSTPDPMRTQK
ncbi:uncharacterized protein LOC120690482 isoform X2 [Panicum virgatum]|uniref:uncharacterized protein LOC120690482 isoform X2 n=1 Tax=Panicum virgatum TaxID=38727 RepID=UPI0019D66140|nr:uncharacterized protein LOC120690482 isoform X2 [Panicum virgatum]